MIFLFDGFDEICPHYMNVAIKCIEVVSKHRQKHTTWVTSRSYSEIKILLQGAFGDPYSMTHMSFKEKYEYLNKIWEANLVLEEFCKTQLQNVQSFLKFMSKIQYFMLAKFEWSLHEVYMNAWFYLKSQINYTNQPSEDQSFSVKYDFEHVSRAILEQLEKLCFDYEEVADHTPLHVFLKACFFINNIKSVNKNSHMKPFAKWHHDNNMFTFYQNYLETSLKTIRYENKNKMDIFNPDIMIAYEKELADCIVKHKKLAAYAIFNQDVEKLFNEKELEEIKETIKRVEKGEDKTGLICGVANDIPIFIHMTFTEYFAAEYVCDLLKNEKDSENQRQMIQFIFNLMVSRSNFANIRTIIDRKITTDMKMNIILENNKEMIGELFEEWVTQMDDECVLSSVKGLLETFTDTFFNSTSTLLTNTDSVDQMKSLWRMVVKECYFGYK
ncbi:hypothetical protein PYW07_013479 [Mythimna separata]|uniref:NACHT domain-containing protein n=1 Tax=Mythimna separata TaxID=271217 RepID=A0AAD8DKI5_MYTSE|nr:hypothetical protein PYW07_013479 [Mythimna separata]